MKENNLSSLNRDISRKLLDSMRLVEVLEELADGEAKTSTLLRIVRHKIRTAFNNIEQCRKILS